VSTTTTIKLIDIETGETVKTVRKSGRSLDALVRVMRELVATNPGCFARIGPRSDAPDGIEVRPK
jgi:hypothetical protein